VTCNSLYYLSREGMMEAVDEATPKREPHRLRVIGEGYCDACFTGNYPIPPGEDTPVRQLHLFEARDR